ncbi:QcrA and Rieske domain-containing protein [Mongoliitalea daihaiensis]|uniref:QcrA and Rieske domain-containing protein n=1 Tax=Mongoliitalea daihaiensis TaxID=2782006 RepID=UPI001F2AD8FF|nr:Rieske (2Fe-2S) protein [Mongoliitalea daihaiensis]UJP64276.1 Rieske (2Fe-2S) protein [Mongoliitalea daihaiensis]
MKKTSEIQTGTLPEARRAFLKKSGALAVMSMFGVGFFTGCSDDTEPGTPPATATPGQGVQFENNVLTIDLSQVSGLANAGGWVLANQARVLVANVGGNQFSALTSVCTHSGCDRNWSFANSVFTCSCHNSRFNVDGSVINGPATRPLQSFPVSRDGNILTIQVS